MALRPPARNFGLVTLPTRTVSAARLYRVSRFATGEPYFGKAASNRFDDRSSVRSRRYGTCYFGLDLETAIAETVLHDEIPVRGRFSVAYSDFASRQQIRLKSGGSLVLADLTGVALKTIGADGSLSTIMPYGLPQLWSMAVHRHPQWVDGIFYVSRHLNDRKAVVVFERAAAKLGTPVYTPLPKAPSIFRATSSLHISFDYA